MRFDVFTLFPQVFEPYLEASILQRAQERGLVTVQVHNIRDWAADRHHVTDDEPYGGGGGMVMKPEPIFSAIEGVLGAPPACPLILLTPQGRPFSQGVAFELCTHPHLALLSGRYEGVDERVRQHLVSDEISIGDYVLSGGEPAAMILLDACIRLLPEVLGNAETHAEESFENGLLEYPHYTRPAIWTGPDGVERSVPEVLVSGHHGRVAAWRQAESGAATKSRRPDLWEKYLKDHS